MLFRSKDVEYFYQPELTQEEKDSGAIRPENVIGSYAVYAKSNKVNYVGGKEYKCGKIGHIYRPKIIDSAGTEVWGDLNIENGIMSVAIPQDFLDNAVYPVRHAAGATFGYTSIGGDSGSIFSGTIGTKFTGSAGTLTSISVYNERGHNRDNKIKCALFKVSDNSFVTNSGSSEETGEQIPGWDNLSVALTPTITAIDYFVTAMIGPYNVPTDAVRLYYDSGDTGQTWEEQMVYGPWPATIFNEFEVDRKYSIYCTYTASGPTYTLTTEVGTFTLSGKATVLKVSRKMVASVGTFALTGIAASLKVARKLTASVGTFNLTGIAAGLFKGYVLVASVGVFTLTGVSAGLKIARKLTASVGTFTLTGINTGLKIARKLTATTGVFVLTGIDVVLTYTAISIVARKFIRSKRKSLQHYIRKPR